MKNMLRCGEHRKGLQGTGYIDMAPHKDLRSTRWANIVSMIRKLGPRGYKLQEGSRRSRQVVVSAERTFSISIEMQHSVIVVVVVIG